MRRYWGIKDIIHSPIETWEIIETAGMYAASLFTESCFRVRPQVAGELFARYMIHHDTLWAILPVQSFKLLTSWKPGKSVGHKSSQNIPPDSEPYAHVAAWWGALLEPHCPGTSGILWAFVGFQQTGAAVVMPFAVLFMWESLGFAGIVLTNAFFGPIDRVSLSDFPKPINPMMIPCWPQCDQFGRYAGPIKGEQDDVSSPGEIGGGRPRGLDPLRYPAMGWHLDPEEWLADADWFTPFK